MRTPLAAAHGGTAQPGEPRWRAVAAQGGHYYNEYCVVCHGQQGLGDGPAGAVLNPKPTNFRDGKYMREQTPAWYFQALSEGVTGSAMGRWDQQLDDQSRWDTAFYVWSLAAAPGALAGGQDLYEARCQSCHGAGGTGVAGARLDDPAGVSQSRASAAKRVSQVHPSIASALKPAELDALVEYLWTFLYKPITPLRSTASTDGGPPLPEGEICTAGE